MILGRTLWYLKFDLIPAVSNNVDIIDSNAHIFKFDDNHFYDHEKVDQIFKDVGTITELGSKMELLGLINFALTPFYFYANQEFFTHRSFIILFRIKTTDLILLSEAKLSISPGITSASLIILLSVV